MEVFEAIYHRHSQKKVKQDALPRPLIEKLLHAAVQAPNHYKVRPWRFVVLTGDARRKLGDVMAASLLERHPEFPQEAFDKARATLTYKLRWSSQSAWISPANQKCLRSKTFAPWQQPVRIFCSPRMQWDWAQSGAQVNGHEMRK